MSFTLLWQKILRSSLWVQESKETRIVWIALLALKDKDGVIQSSLVGLADAAKVTVEECNAALETLMSPDLNDTSGVEEGRRIRKVQGGWQIINNDLYRFSTEAKREFWRQSQQDYRQGRKAQAPAEAALPLSPVNPPAVPEKPPATPKKPERPDLETVKLVAAKIGLSEVEAEKFFSYYEGNGWMMGKHPVKKWTACLSRWKLTAEQYENTRNGGKPNPRNLGMPSTTAEASARVLAELRERGESPA